MTLARVLVVDDEALFRVLVADSLRKHGYLVATAENAEEALTIMERNRADVACIDVDLRSQMNGFETADRIQEIAPGCSIVFLTMVADPEYFQSNSIARLNGCSYLLKTTLRDTTQLAAAIDGALRGDFYIDTNVMGAARGNPMGLTNHQLALLRLAAQGKTNTAIAEELAITLSAVEAGFTRIARTLDLQATPTTNLRVACVSAYLSHALRP